MNEVVAEFEDRFGQTRKIRRTKNGLMVKREVQTVALRLNQVVAEMIGNRIRLRREEQGLSLAELCVKSGLASTHPKSRMWEIEKGVRKEGVRLGTLYAIAHGLGCEVGDIMPTCHEVQVAAGVRGITIQTLSIVA